jgi:hypothetical protein
LYVIRTFFESKHMKTLPIQTLADIPVVVYVPLFKGTH